MNSHCCSLAVYENQLSTDLQSLISVVNKSALLKKLLMKIWLQISLASFLFFDLPLLVVQVMLFTVISSEKRPYEHLLHQTPDTNKCYFKEETFVSGERPLGRQHRKPNLISAAWVETVICKVGGRVGKVYSGRPIKCGCISRSNLSSDVWVGLTWGRFHPSIK